jgi:fibronectin-binding autotransporter adhesin
MRLIAAHLLPFDPIMKNSSTIAARVYLFAIAVIVAPSTLYAQSISWSGATSGAWLTTTNWTGGTAAGSGTSTTNTNIAVFNVNANNTVGINMNTTAGVYYLGAIDNTNATARIINNNSTTVPGVLTLNGATVGGTANTVLRNTTTTLLTITNGASAGTMGLALGNATNNIIQINSTGGITIASNITGSNGITRQGAGAGILTLSGSNSYTGVTAINGTTTGGIVAISNNNALGATGPGNHTTIAANGQTNGPQLRLSNNINVPENITLLGTTEVTGFNGAIQNTSGINTLSGNITLAGTNGLKISALSGTLSLTGTINQTVTSNNLVLQPFAATAVITVANPIQINGGGLQLVGVNGTPGALVNLNAASGTGIGNTSMGQRVTLRLGVTDALNTSGFLTVGYGGSAVGEDMAILDLRGFNQTANALIGSAASGTAASANSNRLVTNSVTGTSILTVGNGGGSGVFNGQINSGTGNIQLIKTGNGNQTLNDQNSYTGGTRIDGGTLTLGHATNTLANTGAINVNGGILALGTNSDTVGAVTLTSGSITGSTGVLTGSSYDVQSGVVSAILGGAGVALTKSTSGTVTLTGNNTYTGNTAINQGRLAVNGSLSTGTVSVAAAAWLQGTGTIAGPVSVSGNLSPGNSPGILTVGSLSLLGSSTTGIEINDIVRGASYDGINITGTSSPLAYGGVLSIAFGNASAFTNGQTFDIFSFTSLFSGSFSSVASTGFYAGTWSNIGSGTYQLASGGQTLTFSPSTGDIIVVPEPATIAILGSAVGLLGLTIARRRKA